ncbi:hypothetical protein V5E97_06920 [Singulisphaera sp. Ch08]|uniref:Uncharacterized protein n=1 Tax=Singulisphaera sp. Ch08 TaxID=3120278 RepID=A0AAU7CKK5_9BACT
MPPVIQDNLGLIFVTAVIVYGIWRLKGKPKLVPSQAPAPVYIQAPAAPERKLLDLHIEYDDDRNREIKREAAKRRLDQAALDREVLLKIAEVMTPPKIDPKP